MNKNEFALTPPMGWNSYDYYDTTVTEDRIKANADYMAAHLKDCGWEYIVVDIEWFAHGAGSMRDRYQYIPFNKLEMDVYGRLLPDPERFPSSADGAGFKPLADYVHALGLKFGIHIMRGIPRAAAHEHRPILMEADERGNLSAGSETGMNTGNTAASNAGTPDNPGRTTASITAADVADPSSICRWNPDMYGLRADMEGSQAYYDSIFALYAQWGVDYVKCDDICNTNAYPHNPYSAAHEIEMIHAAIEKCGRPIVLSLSPGPALIEKAWHYEKYANMWRITDDLWDEWPLLLNMFERCELWQNHVSPGCFPDCDMLPLGTMGKGFGHEWQCRFTKPEQITMMTLWCMFRSPLMIGAELTMLDEWTLSLLTNREVLALLQEGRHGVQVQRTKEFAVWANWGDLFLKKISDDAAPKAVDSEARETDDGDRTGSTLESAANDIYVALFNLKEESAEVSVSMEELADSLPLRGAGHLRRQLQNRNSFPVKELWSGDVQECSRADCIRQNCDRDERAGDDCDSFVLSAAIDAHGAKLFRVML